MAEQEEKGSSNYTTVVFLLSIVSLILYYLFLKPVLDTGILGNAEQFSKYSRQKYIMMIILFFILFTIHMLGNIFHFQSMCGGSITDNIGKVFISTFIPWLLVFGFLMMVLIIFPGFKGAFSNVIGYYAVYRGANEILVKLLGNGTADTIIKESDSKSEDKNTLEKASDAVLKLIGNTGIMINQITPENFTEMWNMMKPVMKPEMRGSEGDKYKEDLLKLAIRRDNIGEFCWYFYTTILLTIMVKTMLLKQKCVTSLSTLKERTAKYNEQEQKQDEQKKKDDSVVYKS